MACLLVPALVGILATAQRAMVPHESWPWEYLLHCLARRPQLFVHACQAPSTEETTKQAMAMGGQLMMRAAAAQQTKMGMRPTAANLLPTSTVSLDTFLHDFSVAKLINKLADLEQHNLRAQIAAVSRPQAQASAAQTAKPAPSAAALVSELQLVDKLLVNFQRCASRLTPCKEDLSQKDRTCGRGVPSRGCALAEHHLMDAWQKGFVNHVVLICQAATKWSVCESLARYSSLVLEGLIID